MAVRGVKPKPTILKLVAGNPGKRPIPRAEARPEGSPEKPRLPPEASRLWDARIARAFWLTWADSDKAAMWCLLQAEFYASEGAMIAARIGQLRALGSELGFDPASRARIGPDAKTKETKDPAAEFLA